MPTTSKGLYYPDDTTAVAPLHPVLGAMQTSVDSYLSSNATIHSIANVAARVGLVALYPPSTAAPLFAWRQDATSGLNLEYTTNGSTWVAYGALVTPGVGFTPTWNGVTLGNGTSAGQYFQQGKLVQATMNLTIGSTTAFTAGAFIYPSIPVAGAAVAYGAGWIFDSSPTGWYNIVFTIGAYLTGTNGQRVTATLPITLAAADGIRTSITYQAL